MKHLVFILLLSFNLAQCISQEISFTFKGRVNKESKAEKLYLEGNFIDVEIPITNDREFYYKGTAKQPGECFIKTDKSFAWRIWIANGDIDVTLQEWEYDEPDPSGKKFLKISSLAGPAETEKHKWFDDEKLKIIKRFPNMSFAQRQDSMAKYFDPLLEDYILQHPHSKLSVRLGQIAYSKENRKRLLSAVDQEISAEERLQVENSLIRQSATKTGLAIEDFEMKTLQGKTFNSRKLSSKYTLLDFWTYNCYPCRAQHPALIKIYNDFHPVGFEIVSVFLADSKIKWRKAVTEDQLPWVHASDLKGWNNFLAKRFFIDVMPFNILIDSNKTIIATGLNPTDLRQKLKELMSN